MLKINNKISHLHPRFEYTEQHSLHRLMLRQLPPLSYRTQVGAPFADPAGTMGATGATFEGPEVDHHNLVQSSR